jgi:YggT family protein
MTEAYFTNPLIFLVKTLFGLYVSIVVIRFLLQWARADFYNPISQFVVTLTSPVLRPLRKLIPGWGGIDLASVLLAWLLKAAELAILTLLIGLDRNPLLALAWAVPALVRPGDQHLPVRDPDSRHPELGEPRPLQSGGEPARPDHRPNPDPAQRLLPAISGIDLSPMVAMIGLVLLEMLLVPPLALLTGSPF